MKRTIIEATDEGKITLIREAQNKLTGSTRERRQQMRVSHHLNWHRVKKHTVNSVLELNTKKEDCPFEFVTAPTHEGTLNSQVNGYTANVYVEDARLKVLKIEDQNESFTLRVKVIGLGSMVTGEPIRDCTRLNEQELNCLERGDVVPCEPCRIWASWAVQQVRPF